MGRDHFALSQTAPVEWFPMPISAGADGPDVTLASNMVPPSVPPIVRHLAEQFAVHRVVPFVGAGCSISHVRLDWDALRDEMTLACGTAPSPDHLAVASEYVLRFGKAGLASLLRSRLDVPFDAAKGSVQLHLLGLGPSVIYTTNQDSLIEQCFVKHGRRASVVVGIDDIATLLPGDTVVYKYHGDLKAADSIVFCTEDYATRGPTSDHHLDIRLRSDALAKSLVFFGYSFRDPNVQELFVHLKRLFGGSLPPSYLVQYASDRTFADRLGAQYGVQAVDCRAEYPDATSDEDAFCAFLRDLVRETRTLKAERELEDAFKPSVPVTRAVATSVEVGHLTSIVRDAEWSTAMRAFRATYDQAFIPPDFRDEVAQQFAVLAERATSGPQAMSLSAALFNLDLGQEHVVGVLGDCCTAANLFQPNDDLILFHPSASTPGGSALSILGVAMAILRLKDWGRPLTPAFYRWVANQSAAFPTPNDLPAAVRAHLEPIFAYAYERPRTTFENPLTRSARLAEHPLFRVPTHSQLYASMTAMLPKRLTAPYRDS